ncbi:hypothetical protein GGX14DRAFT_564137 [Mycena pura]|uniref:F-box domain-containing protein n=1 Tax=Mycena pura TaxID=153505 RepID=A0AAD6YGZ9_9AGAR|nr:hypothetical protein GGX14DRAFT_564137 [Mycena pura]
MPSTAPDAETTAPSNAPIKKLPVELLGEIFMWTLGDWGMMTDEPPRLLLEPLTLSHVCVHWRSVAISIPMLWAAIWIDRPRAAHIHMVELWVERSQSCLLSIHLRQTDPKSRLSFPASIEHDLTDEILTLLIPHLHRWHVVEFLFSADAQRPLTSLPVDEATALEHVALHVDSWDAAVAESLQTALYSRPSLRSLHLMPASNLKCVQWKQLTHLVAVPECTLDTCLGILASCPTLSSATFTCSAQPDWAHTPFSYPDQYLTLPSLVDISLKASRIDLSPFFNRLTLPALRSLALDYCHVPRATPDHQSLHNLLDRSGCALEFFSLHETARICDENRPIAFLQTPHLSSLLVLELRVDITDKIIHFLTFGAERAPTLPNLTDMSLTDNRGDHISDVALAQMILSRLAPPDSSSSTACLRFAELHLRLQSHSNCAILADSCRDDLELRFTPLNCFCK